MKRIIFAIFLAGAMVIPSSVFAGTGMTLYAKDGTIIENITEIGVKGNLFILEVCKKRCSYIEYPVENTRIEAGELELFYADEQWYARGNDGWITPISLEIDGKRK